ncbi:MAG: hypothetical protein ACK4PR_09560 [Gammaproteobacteria bacterium]
MSLTKKNQSILLFKKIAITPVQATSEPSDEPSEEFVALTSAFYLLGPVTPRSEETEDTTEKSITSEPPRSMTL